MTATAVRFGDFASLIGEEISDRDDEGRYLPRCVRHGLSFFASYDERGFRRIPASFRVPAPSGRWASDVRTGNVIARCIRTGDDWLWVILGLVPVPDQQSIGGPGNRPHVSFLLAPVLDGWVAGPPETTPPIDARTFVDVLTIRRKLPGAEETLETVTLAGLAAVA